jgi:hypothetical protein
VSRRRSSLKGRPVRRGTYVRESRRSRVSVPSWLSGTVAVILVLLAVWLGSRGGLTTPVRHASTPAPVRHSAPAVHRTHAKH